MPRSDSLSSLDIQVTSETVFTTTTTTTALASQQQDLVCPRTEFLSLLKTVGAKGTSSSTGELFTFKEVVGHLREYIKLRQLYDPCDPSIVHCGADPLGQVLGVGRFTLYDTLRLIRENVQVVKPPAKSPRKPRLSRHQSAVELTDKDDLDRAGSCQAAAAQPSTSRKDQESKTDRAENKEEKKRFRRKKRARCDSSSAGSTALCRRRQSSFSIVYTSEGEGPWGDEPSAWYLALELEETAGESEVLSVQSKETMLVQSSSDDLWFLEEDEEVEQISVELGPDDISIELQTSHQEAYIEEYEVESSTSSSFASTGDDDESRAVEEIMLVCDDSDTMFWADSESSDADPDSTDDDDLEDGDKWQCSECSTMNSPLCRYCDRCWKVRPGWLRGGEHPPNVVPPSPATPDKATADAPSSSPSLHGAYFNRENFRNRLNMARNRASSRLRSVSSSSRTSVSSLMKIDIMPVTEKVHLLLDKSAPASENSDSNGPASHIETLPPPSSPGCSSKLASPHSRRRHRISSLRRDDSGLGSSQMSASFPELLTQSPNKSSQNDAAPGPSTQCSTTSSKQTARLHRSNLSQSVAASPCKSNVSSKSVGILSSADVCVICFSKPKEASIVHGKTGHQVCCYKCAKRLRRRGKPCPVCRRPIRAVIRNFVL